jgi:photoactive yellow protein
MSANESLDAVPDALELERLAKMSPAELDALPFGAIQLDRAGTILTYNIAESVISGRDPGRMIGKNFFEEVAPCTNVQGFAGRFREGMARRELRVVFRHRFDFEMAPRNVAITLFYSAITDTGWVFVREPLA